MPARIDTPSIGGVTVRRAADFLSKDAFWLWLMPSHSD